jgi:guanylate kinase
MSVRGTLYIVSAPSGGGKTSLVNALAAACTGITLSVSHTTRPPRKGEVEGRHYFFVSDTFFQEAIQQNHFLEHAKVFNYFYGTSKTAVQNALEQGSDVFLDIDWQGARQIKAQMECVEIFVIPPSVEVLMERLQNRRQDSKAIIAERMKQASYEISHYNEYDYLIVNDSFAQALEDLKSIVKAQRLAIEHQKQIHASLLKELLLN